MATVTVNRMNCGLSAPRTTGPPLFPSRLTTKFANSVFFGISFVVFRWVFIEIELDLFVDYKTSFAFVLATDAASSSKHTLLRNFHSRPTPMYSFVAYHHVDAV